MEKAKRVVSFRLAAVISVVAITFFALANPSSDNSFIIITGTILLAASVYVWSGALIRLVSAFYPLQLRSQRRLATLMALLVMFVILMQSIGQLDWRDVVTILPLAGALYAYISFATKTPQRSKSDT